VTGSSSTPMGAAKARTSRSTASSRSSTATSPSSWRPPKARASRLERADQTESATPARHGLPGNAHFLPQFGLQPGVVGPTATARCRRLSSSRPSHTGPLSSSWAARICGAFRPNALRRPWPAARARGSLRLARRRGEGQPIPGADATSPDGAFLHDAALDVCAAGRQALQPGVAGAQRRVAGERQLAAGREDAHAVVGPRAGRWAAARRWFPTGWSSARSAAGPRRPGPGRPAPRPAGCRSRA
jgi:hypothetical protein